MKPAEIVWKRFRTNRLAVAGLAAVAAIMLAAVFAPMITPYGPNAINVDLILSPPSSSHPLGTDDLGRDVLSRMLAGGRVSLSVGFVASGIAILIGMFIGALAGYFGGWLDSVLMRFVDVMLTIPTIFLILAVVAIVEQAGIYVIMIIIGATGWMDVARLVRAEFLTLRERDYVLAARAMGAGNTRIMFRHIMPNALSPVFVSATFGVAGAILLESALSFLGLGVQAPDASWGNILMAGKDHIEIAWWMSVFPGLAILVTVCGYNLIGEGLRDALDPRLWESEN